MPEVMITELFSELKNMPSSDSKYDAYRLDVTVSELPTEVVFLMIVVVIALVTSS